MKNVIGKENAVKFVTENCSYKTEDYLEEVRIGLSSYQEEKAQMYERLAIEGVSEVVEVYQFRHDTRGNEYQNIPPHWYLDTKFVALRLIKTDTVLIAFEPHYNAKKYGFSPLERNYNERLSHFKYDEPQPNYIGKATEKKLDAWYQWLNRKRNAELQYIATANSKNAEFKDAVRRNFPDANMRVLDDGWLSECYIDSGNLTFHYEANDSGAFYRDVRVNPFKTPSTYQLLGIEA